MTKKSKLYYSHYNSSTIQYRGLLFCATLCNLNIRVETDTLYLVRQRCNGYHVTVAYCQQHRTDL